MSLSLLGWHDTNRRAANAGARSQRSSFARFVFTTTATSLTISGVSTQSTVGATGNELGVWVDGAWSSAISVASDGQRHDATISLSAGSHTVEIVEGPQTHVGGAECKPTLLAGITGNAAITPVAWTGPEAGNVVVVGDSTSVGAFVTDPTHQAALMQLRYTSGYHVTSWGHGSRALYDRVQNASDAAAFAAFLSSMLGAGGRLYLADAINDYYGTAGAGYWSATSFGVALGLLLDAVRALRPDVTIFVQTMLPTGVETTANGFGDKPPAYRTAATSAASGKATLVDASGWAVTRVDSFHPNTASQATIAANMAAALGAP